MRSSETAGYRANLGHRINSGEAHYFAHASIAEYRIPPTIFRRFPVFYTANTMLNFGLKQLSALLAAKKISSTELTGEFLKRSRALNTQATTLSLRSMKRQASPRRARPMQ